MKTAQTFSEKVSPVSPLSSTVPAVETKLPHAKIIFALQVATKLPLPSRATFHAWARAALTYTGRGGELTVRVVDEDEMKNLNHRYRGIAAATDVLAFACADALPAAAKAARHEHEHENKHEHEQTEILGDVVICAPLATAPEHFAHLVVHGVLHLCGYDHARADDALRMSAAEHAILKTFNITPPSLPMAEEMKRDAA